MPDRIAATADRPVEADDRSAAGPLRSCSFTPTRWHGRGQRDDQLVQAFHLVSGGAVRGRPHSPAASAPIRLTTLPKRSTLVVCALTIQACADGHAGRRWQYRYRSRTGAQARGTHVSWPVRPGRLSRGSSATGRPEHGLQMGARCGRLPAISRASGPCALRQSAVSLGRLRPRRSRATFIGPSAAPELPSAACRRAGSAT